MNRPRVHVYSVCWNEIRMLPYFLRHYETIAERIVVYDDRSDDGSVELLRAYPKVEVRSLSGSRVSPESDRRDVKSHAWKECRGVADWVIACDVDEFLYHPEMLDFLATCQHRGITLPLPEGCQLFAEWFPTTHGQIYEELRFGFADSEYNKPALFDPNAIEDMGYNAGCHLAEPTGRVVSERSPHLRLLHAKFLGLSYVQERYRALAGRCTQHDRDQGWDYQYFWDDFQLDQQWSNYRARAKPLFVSAEATVPEDSDARPSTSQIESNSKRKDVAVFVVSWNRPEFLRQTLNSLFACCDGLQADIFVVDNGSNHETQQVILSEPRLAGHYFNESNLGINGGLESAVPNDLVKHYQCILISDADMLYLKPLQRGVEFLNRSPEIGAVSYQHSPEHLEIGRESDGQSEWVLKESERGCALLLRGEDFQAMRPLPVENLKDFDWWIMRDGPNSLSCQSRRVGVLLGGARHLGWRKGDSTWQPDEIPEFAEYRT